MRQITVLLFILTSQTISYCQTPQNVSVDKTRDYRVRDEDKVFSLVDKTFKRKSDVQIIFPELSSDLLTMPQVHATTTDDTLRVTLESINEAIYSKYTIKIIDKKCLITFHFTESGQATDPREITADNYKLVLDHGDFKKGNTIKGHTEFQGRCLTGYCPEYVKDLKVKGNFVVKVE